MVTEGRNSFPETPLLLMMMSICFPPQAATSWRGPSRVPRSAWTTRKVWEGYWEEREAWTEEHAEEDLGEEWLRIMEQPLEARLWAMASPIPIRGLTG